jgi:hypothetical protein
MKAARLTAASVHHFADPCEPRDPSRPGGLARSADSVLVSVLADTTIVLSRGLGLGPVFVPYVHVLRTYTMYRYVVKHYLYGV